VLTDVEVEFDGLEVSDLYPQAVPDLFQGSSLLLTGRYEYQTTARTVAVRVRGRAGDERREYIYHFDLNQTSKGDFVPRLWATRRVGELLDWVRVEGESPALVDEIRDLGLGYGLVTPYTTFVIEGQADGPASAANMRLYQQSNLNQAWGQTTIQARVQNQAYQQAGQASLASGANVVNNGQRSLAQLGSQNVDLSLLQGQANLDAPITEEWVARNVGIDRTVTFGSEEYFTLAKDPAVRSFLQSGLNVIFAYQGQVISVQESKHQNEGPDTTDQGSDQQSGDSDATDQDSEQQGHLSDSTGQNTEHRAYHSGITGVQKIALVGCLAPYAAAMLLGLLVVGAKCYWKLRPG